LRQTLYEELASFSSSRFSRIAMQVAKDIHIEDRCTGAWENNEKNEIQIMRKEIDSLPYSSP